MNTKCFTILVWVMAGLTNPLPASYDKNVVLSTTSTLFSFLYASQHVHEHCSFVFRERFTLFGDVSKVYIVRREDDNGMRKPDPPFFFRKRVADSTHCYESKRAAQPDLHLWQSAEPERKSPVVTSDPNLPLQKWWLMMSLCHFAHARSKEIQIWLSSSSFKIFLASHPERLSSFKKSHDRKEGFSVLAKHTRKKHKITVFLFVMFLNFCTATNPAHT